MSKAKRLIPELRFPEFKNEESWDEIPIESLGNVVTGSTPSMEESEYWDGGFVWVTARDFKEKYIYNSVLKLTDKGKEKSRLIPKNSVLVTCIASIGLNGINRVECATNQQINSIICNSSNHYEFVYYAISKNISRLKNLAGQTALPIINKSVFEKFTIQKPNLLQEQQKIASCLSSLDELITAHNQKLEALKVQKKGLMKQLFPAEGENVPTLRFPEFKDSGEWVERKLEDVAVFLKGKGISKSDISSNGSLSCIRYGELYTRYTEVINSVFSSTNLSSQDLILSKANDVIIPSSGETREDIATASCVLKSGIALGGDLNIIRSEINGIYLSYYLSYAKKESIAKLAQGNAVVHLYASQLKSLLVNFPERKDEQQKIASLLSSLDHLISTQTQKIETLKAHKKGLMQQLFPAINPLDE